MSDLEERSESGAVPLGELLGAVPRIVARRLRHVYANSDDRHRATLTVIAEVFLALADRQLDPTPDLVRSLALTAAQHIETVEKRHRRRPTGNDGDLAAAACDGAADARREHQADLSAWWQLVFEQLEPDEVAVFELRLDEVDDAEAAARLGRSESKLRKRRSRAYAKIRERIRARALPRPP
jgi:DNA-directed RNA polymerase specialized sigma24 family protein